MKIRKITSINTYKSFSDFSWSKFCKNASGQEEVLNNFSIFFGENGSGKSSICEILKNLTQISEFTDNTPSLAEIEINDDSGNVVHKYENGNWMNSRLQENSILFFDVDFVNVNIHTHGIRANNLQQGGHTQKAGKLIIDLDENANELKGIVVDKKNESEIFDKSCADTLSLNFSDKDQELYKTYKDTDGKAKKDKIIKLQEKLKITEVALVSLKKLNSRYAEIGKLSEVKELVFNSTILDKLTITELFNRQIKEKSQDKADSQVKEHFEKHKDFIEGARNKIPQDYKNENCPLCMQPLANASKVIEFYRATFDETYEKEKERFLSDIQNAKDNIGNLKSIVLSMPKNIAIIFDELEKLKTDFELSDVYSLEERKEYASKINDISAKDLDELIKALDLLKSIERKTIADEKLYSEAEKTLLDVKDAVQSVNHLVSTKNKILTDFINKYSDRNKITTEITENTQEITQLQEVVAFLNMDKITFMNKHREVVVKQKELAGELKKAEDDLKNYLANTIPESVIDKMISILNKFNLTFTLEHITPAPNTRDYSFSFKIKDTKGNERDLKDGLSEGERQLISLSFFFAINDKVSDRQKKVLVFDDPITSLDSPNLKILAELIQLKTQEFSQVIVFTHHPLFFKYLAKCEDPNPYKFGVLKNIDTFGGSFVFCDPGFDLINELQKCAEEISKNAQNGNLKPEEVALKYGQLLRLTVEKFIKNDLLMWDKEKNFEKEIISNLSSSQNKIGKLDNADLETLMNIYKYCNYSNLLHADKEAPSALSELTNHITKFNLILDKVTN